MQIYKAIPLELYNTLMNKMEKTPKISKNAKTLLDLLEKADGFTWNSEGEIIYKDQIVSGSNILDLVEYVTTGKSNLNKTGFDIFQQVLNVLKIPRTLFKVEVRHTVPGNWTFYKE
jgi:hypothetical protein